MENAEDARRIEWSEPAQVERLIHRRSWEESGLAVNRTKELPFPAIPKKRPYEGGYLDEISSLIKRRRTRDEGSVLDDRGVRRFGRLYTGPRQMRLDPLRWVVPIPRAAVSCVVAFHHG